MKTLTLKKKHTRNLSDLIRIKHLMACGGLGILMATATPMSLDVASAAPPSHAPAWAYGKDKKPAKTKKAKKAKVLDRYRDRNDAGNNYVSTPIDVTGQVISITSSRRLIVRGDNGRTYTVITRRALTSNIDRGDRVRLKGRVTSANRLTVNQVELVQDINDDGVGSTINITGRVISIASSRQLVVRGDNGRTYTVLTRRALTSNIDRGDRVRLRGQVTSTNRITVDQVELVQNVNDNSNGQTVDFRGTVQADLAGSLLTVRGDNGRTYSVRHRNNTSFSRGERVRVVGTYVNGVVVATSVTRL